MQIINPPVAASAGYKMQPTGAWFTVFQNVTAAGATFAYTAALIAAVPVRILGDCNLTVSVNVTSAAAAGGKFSVALYNNDPTSGNPGALAYDLGELDVTTTGVKTGNTTAVKAGIYWCYGQASLAFTGTGVTLNTGDIPTQVTSTTTRLYLTSSANPYVRAPANISSYTWTNGTTGYTQIILFAIT